MTNQDHEYSSVDSSQPIIDINIKIFPLSYIEPDPNQTRKFFNETAIAELASSIKEKGIINPLLVKEIGDNKYQIIGGERRYRAAKEVGLEQVPVRIVLRDFEIVALIDNMLRADLTPMEEACAYKNLLNEHNIPQKKLAEILGKAESTISEYISIATLPAEIITEVLVDDSWTKKGLLNIAKCKTPTTQKSLFEKSKQRIKNKQSLASLTKKQRSNKTGTIIKLINTASNKLDSIVKDKMSDVEQKALQEAIEKLSSKLSNLLIKSA